MALLNDEEQLRISKAIEAAEKHTSGEIRVCIEKTCSEDVLNRAAGYFLKLEMQHTKHRHGVLIYLATVDRKFAIIGDKGINRVVSADFWDTTKNAMLKHFKFGDMVEGIITGLQIAGGQLSQHFPNEEKNKQNELPNEVVFMNGN
jgi:uncharacterized membrane protein